MNNDERDQTGASEGMPEDLKRLLARAEEQEEGAYNPDADSDEEDDDDEELEGELWRQHPRRGRRYGHQRWLSAD